MSNWVHDTIVASLGAIVGSVGVALGLKPKLDRLVVDMQDLKNTVVFADTCVKCGQDTTHRLENQTMMISGLSDDVRELGKDIKQLLSRGTRVI